MNECVLRREKLFSSLKENSACLVFAGAPKIKSEDENYPFWVNRFFYYLTGISQENSILLLINGINEKKEYLFIDEFSPLKEKWTGKMLREEKASDISKIQNVYFTKDFLSMLSLILKDEDNAYGPIKTMYLDLSKELKISDEMTTVAFAESLANDYPHLQIENINPLLTAMRMVKSNEEISNIIKAINATNEGLGHLIGCIKPGIKEKHLADIFEFFGREKDFRELAFPTIVASGKNATCLHYPSQNDSLKEDDLVLFDLGYSYNGYSADISRTYPVSGVFKGMAKQIYQAVLNCNKAVIEYVRAGMSIADLQTFTRDYLYKECVSLGLLKEGEDVMKYYFHNISHHLGLDTHDVADRNAPLTNGNVITVEPGLYVEELGIGVRIEDDVLITNGRGECLSKNIVKEIKDIECLFKASRKR